MRLPDHTQSRVFVPWGSEMFPGGFFPVLCQCCQLRSLENRDTIFLASQIAGNLAPPGPPTAGAFFFGTPPDRRPLAIGIKSASPYGSSRGSHLPYTPKQSRPRGLPACGLFKMEKKISWPDHYISAALETGEALPDRISAARHAIAARLEDLPQEGARKERQDLEAALVGLRAIENQWIPR